MGRRFAYVSVFILFGFASVGGQSAQEKLRRVADNYWEWRLRTFPESATSYGFHEYDDRLDEMTEEAFMNSKVKSEEFLADIHKINKGDLQGVDLDTYEVLRDEISQYVAGYRWKDFGNLNTANFLEGVHRSPEWVDAMKFDTSNDYSKYMKRMEAYPVQINQSIALMKKAIQLRRTNHMVSMITVPGQISNATKDSEQSKFYQPFRDEVLGNSSVQKDQWAALRLQAVKIINEQINPAYRKLEEFIQNEYMKNTRREHGVWVWDGGRDFYQACLRFHISYNMTAEQVRDIGLQELARIRSQMLQIMRENKFEGTLPQFFEYLRTNKRKEYYDRTPEWLFDEYKKIVYERIDPKLPAFFHDMPPFPRIKVEPQPYDGPPGLYGPNTFLVNLRNAQDRPTFTMMALSAHEANPGHHLQISGAKQLVLPIFRRFAPGSWYYSVPFAFPWYTSYSEGWALYAEYLGEEMNLYNKTALELFGRYSWEIVRACRLVVDTGMHAFKMTRQEAIELMANNTAMPLKQIKLEVDRYITWPGQACAYKIGEMEIRRWRQNAESKLGSLFDVKDFHRAVLGTGRAPLAVAERAVQDYITVTAAAPSNMSLQTLINICLSLVLYPEWLRLCTET